MEKVFDLLETAIAVMLVVAALSTQLYDNSRLTTAIKTEEKAAVLTDAELRYSCNGMELISHLCLLAEKEEPKIIYANTEYRFSEFCQKILGLTIAEENRKFILSFGKQTDLQKREFQMYQQDGIWRIKE